MRAFVDWFILWFKAARAPFLVVSIVPAVLGGVMAAAHQSINGLHFFLAVVGIAAAHSAGDFLDDYFDFRKGILGNKTKQFHDSPMIDGKITPQQVLYAGIICLAVAGLAGAYLLVKIAWPVVVMAAIGAVIAIFYTAPPISLNFRGYGELGLFIAFGPLAVVGVYYVLTGVFSWEPLVASLPLGVFTMNIGNISAMFDYRSDINFEKKVMIVRYGPEKSYKILTVLFLAAYIPIIVGVAAGLLPTAALLALLTLPLTIGVLIALRQYHDTSKYASTMGMAIGQSTLTGLLLCLAYLLA
jgi:1,4-dihydroxy-2-naphthoate octaprenyltransferase